MKGSPGVPTTQGVLIRPYSVSRGKLLNFPRSPSTMRRGDLEKSQSWAGRAREDLSKVCLFLSLRKELLNTAPREQFFRGEITLWMARVDTHPPPTPHLILQSLYLTQSTSTTVPLKKKKKVK